MPYKYAISNFEVSMDIKIFWEFVLVPFDKLLMIEISLSIDDVISNP